MINCEENYHTRSRKNDLPNPYVTTQKNVFKLGPLIIEWIIELTDMLKASIQTLALTVQTFDKLMLSLDMTNAVLDNTTIKKCALVCFSLCFKYVESILIPM